MFKAYILHRNAFWIRFSTLLFCLTFCNCVSRQSHESSEIFGFRNESAFWGYRFQSNWKLAPVGKSALDFLGVFFTYPFVEAFRYAVQNEYDSYQKFIRNFIAYTFLQQIAMTIMVALGLFCVLLLFILPFCVAIIRNRQTSAFRKPHVKNCFVSPQQGWLVYEFLFVFLVTSVFGGVLMCISVQQYKEKQPEIFTFASEFVNISYEMKETFLNSFYGSLGDIHRSAFEVIKLIYDVIDEVGKQFMKNVNQEMEPIDFLSKSIRWEVIALEKSLNKIKENFEELKTTSDKAILDLTQEYSATLNELKAVFDNENATLIFGSAVEPLLAIPSYSSNVTFEDFNAAIERLKKASIIDLQMKLRNFSRFLRDNIAYPDYDPSQLIDDLRQIAFDIHEQIGTTLRDFASDIDGLFKVKRKEHLARFINKYRTKVLRDFNYLHAVLLIFSVIGASLGIFLLIMFSLGVIGTKGFRIKYPCVYRSRLSHISGKIIVLFIYISVVFLALFWLLSIFIFVLLALPYGFCDSIKDKTIFDVTFDYPAFHKSHDWHSLFSSKKYNYTLKEHVVKCRRNISYFGLLPDPMVNYSVFRTIIDNLGKYSVNPSIIENSMQNLPDINISDTELTTLDLEAVLNIDVRSYFNDVLDYLRQLTTMNASSILNSIKTHSKSSENLSSAAETAAKSYESLVVFLSTTAASGDIYNTSISSLNITAQMLLVKIDIFKYSTESLAYFMKNSTHLYMTTFNSTITEVINAVYINIYVGALEFRKSISFCPTLIFLYEKFLLLMCDVTLKPASAFWLGSVLVDIFLLLSVLLCLYSVPLFLKPRVIISSQVSLAVFEAENATISNKTRESGPDTDEDEEEKQSEKTSLSSSSSKSNQATSSASIKSDTKESETRKIENDSDDSIKISSSEKTNEKSLGGILKDPGQDKSTDEKDTGLDKSKNEEDTEHISTDEKETGHDSTDKKDTQHDNSKKGKET